MRDYAKFLCFLIPTFLVIFCCSFCAKCSQGTVQSLAVFLYVQENFFDYQKGYVCQANDWYYIDFEAAPGTENFQQGGVLEVRFSKNEFVPVSATNTYKRCAWRLGRVEHQHNGQWKPLFPAIRKDEDYQVPFTVRDNEITDNDGGWSIDHNTFFTQVLPTALSHNEDGETAHVIGKKDCSPKKITTHAQN